MPRSYASLLLLACGASAFSAKPLPMACMRPGAALTATRASATMLTMDETPTAASNIGLMLSGALLAAAARPPLSWPSSCVRIGLASLTLLDFRPTATRQLEDVQAALAEMDNPMPGKQWRSRASRSEVAQWAQLVRSKVAGEFVGLTLALLNPCLGAILVLGSHLLFWQRGAAGARVDAAAKPAPIPPKLVKVIATADTIVLFFAALGAFGPTRLLRNIGAALFTAAAAFVSAENVPAMLSRRADAARVKEEIALADLPELTVKG